VERLRFVQVLGRKKMNVSIILNILLALFKYVILIFIILIIGIGTFQWLSSIDEVITSGESDGFKIDDTKKEIYQVLFASSAANYERRVVLFNEALKEKHEPVIINSVFNKEEFYLFEDKNEWLLSFDTAYYTDKVTLHFCDDKLCRIWRARSYLQFP
jgi:hypothetical protein